MTAAWPYEAGTSPDGFHKEGDLVTVVCTNRVGNEEFAGIAAKPSQLNYSAAPDESIDMRGDDQVVYGRLRWLIPIGQDSFTALPSC
jgi:hypothetical protein